LCSAFFVYVIVIKDGVKLLIKLSPFLVCLFLKELERAKSRNIIHLPTNPHIPGMSLSSAFPRYFFYQFFLEVFLIDQSVFSFFVRFKKPFLHTNEHF